MKGPGQIINRRQARLGLLPALASPRRKKDYADYLQNPYTPHMKGICRTPLAFRSFCKASRQLERIQARLKALGEADQSEAREYKDLEREESKLCAALGY